MELRVPLLMALSAETRPSTRLQMCTGSALNRIRPSIVSERNRGGQLGLLARRRRAILLAIATSLLHAPLPGQTTATVSSTVSCRPCRLELVRVATLGDTGGPGEVHQQGVVSRDSRGRFFVTSNGDPSTVRVFNQDGRFLASFGRTGAAPGEFTARPDLVMGPGDSLIAIDRAARRATVFDPEYRVARTIQLRAYSGDAIRLPDGRLVVTGNSRTAALIGLPLHLLDARGTLVRSFGSIDERVDLRDRFSMLRSIAPSAYGGIWSAKPNSYIIEKWDTTGSLRVRVERSADWFRPWTRPQGALGVTRQPPWLVDMAEHSDTLLVLIRVDDSEWQPRRTAPAPGVPGEFWMPDADKELLYDTIVEVIDVKSGRLVVSQRFRQNLLGIVSADMVASYEEDEQGNPKYVVWRLNLLRPQ